jgi:hypothetical protein
MDSREQYDYGWNKRGQRFLAPTSRPQERVNIIAALCNQNLMLRSLLRGRVIELCWKRKLEICLLPTLTRRQVVVMDNATFHTGGGIRELIETVGCQLLYLPPNSRLPQLALSNVGIG